MHSYIACRPKLSFREITQYRNAKASKGVAPNEKFHLKQQVLHLLFHYSHFEHIGSEAFVQWHCGGIDNDIS